MVPQSKFVKNINRNNTKKIKKFMKFLLEFLTDIDGGITLQLLKL